MTEEVILQIIQGVLDGLESQEMELSSNTIDDLSAQISYEINNSEIAENMSLISLYVPFIFVLLVLRTLHNAFNKLRGVD